MKEQRLCDQVRQITIKKELEQAEQDETSREVQTEYYGVVMQELPSTGYEYIQNVLKCQCLITKFWFLRGTYSM